MAQRNKLAAQIIKAEILGDQERVSALKIELANLPSVSDQPAKLNVETRPEQRQRNNVRQNEVVDTRLHRNNKVQKFISSTSSLSSMFVQEKRLSTSDEAKMFMKNAANLSDDDVETGLYNEVQEPHHKTKRHKPNSDIDATRDTERSERKVPCDLCLERQAQHLLIDDDLHHVYMLLNGSKPFLSSMGCVVIRNNDHSCNSFAASSEKHQAEVESIIARLGKAWGSKGYSCIVMETHFRSRRAGSREITSCGDHFQIHCVAVREKYIERARLCFKQTFQTIESEQSVNKRLIQTDEKRIQRYLPIGLSYFWVCFNDLKKGFGYVVESERDFSRYFGFEVLAGMLDKEFNPPKLCQPEKFNEQFARCREFKLLYSNFRKD